MQTFLTINFYQDSGVLNVNKYLKAYSGAKPEFIEDNTFKVIIPLSSSPLFVREGLGESLVDGANKLTVGENALSDGANELTVGENALSDGANKLTVGENALSDGAIELVSEILKLRVDIKQNIEKLLISIIKNEGKKATDYVLLTKFQKRAVERYIKILRENNLVEFIGEIKAKTSGYFLTEDLKKRIKHE